MAAAVATPAAGEAPTPTPAAAVAVPVPAAEPAAAAVAKPAAAAKAEPGAAEAVGKKRGATPGQDQGDNKRRKADFTVCDRGAFFTCTIPSVSPNARRDLYRLLDAAAGEAASKEAAGGTAETSASAKLDAELKELKETSKAPRFVGCDKDIARGTGFIKFTVEGDVPSKLVPKILDTQKAKFQASRVAPSSKLLCRVLPIDHTCKPFIEDFKKLAETVLTPHLGAEADPTVWGLEFKSRNMTTLKKEAVLAAIDEIATKTPGRHKVNLTNPEKCILVEVNPMFCGLTVVERWAELKKYNLTAITTSDEADKKAASPAPSAAAVAAPAAVASTAGDAAVANEATKKPASPAPSAAAVAAPAAVTSTAGDAAVATAAPAAAAPAPAVGSASTGGEAAAPSAASS